MTLPRCVDDSRSQTVPCQSFCQFLKVKNPSKLLQKDFPLGGVVKCDNDSVVRVNCVVLSDSGKSFRPGVTDDAKDAAPWRGGVEVKWERRGGKR